MENDGGPEKIYGYSMINAVLMTTVGRSYSIKSQHIYVKNLTTWLSLSLRVSIDLRPNSHRNEIKHWMLYLLREKPCAKLWFHNKACTHNSKFSILKFNGYSTMARKFGIPENKLTNLGLCIFVISSDLFESMYRLQHYPCLEKLGDCTQHNERISKHWFRLLSFPQDSILKNVYVELIYTESCGQRSWCQIVRDTLNEYQMDVRVPLFAPWF